MATKAKAKKATKKASTINSGLINASMAAINTTVENGEKWQKLASKLIKKSEPVRTKQINMVFDTASAVKKQVTTGSGRMMNLVGYDASVVEKALNFATKNPVSKKVFSVAEGIVDKVTSNPVVKKVEKTTDDIKKMSIAKFNDVKEDVLEQAKKALQKGEDLVEEAKTPKKTPKKTTKKVIAKGDAKVKTARKTTTKKVATAKKTTAKKVVAVKETAKAIVTEVKTESAKKVAEIKEVGKEKVAAVKTETKKTIKTSAKDDLKIVYGIGPKLEDVFNKNGINTYAELAKTEEAKIEAILEEAGPIFKNTDTSDWKKQAEVGAEKGGAALKVWVARYRTA